MRWGKVFISAPPPSLPTDFSSHFPFVCRLPIFLSLSFFLFTRSLHFFFSPPPPPTVSSKQSDFSQHENYLLHVLCKEKPKLKPRKGHLDKNYGSSVPILYVGQNVAPSITFFHAQKMLGKDECRPANEKKSFVVLGRSLSSCPANIK